MKTIDRLWLEMWDNYEEEFVIEITLWFGIVLALPGAMMIAMYL